MTVSEDLVLRDIAGDTILVPVGPLALKLHGMISLSESGALLFRCLQKGAAEENLVSAMLAEYDVPEETAREDVAAFLKKLRDLDLIEE